MTSAFWNTSARDDFLRALQGFRKMTRHEDRGRMKLLNVRLALDDARMVAHLKQHGIQLSSVGPRRHPRTDARVFLVHLPFSFTSS